LAAVKKILVVEDDPVNQMILSDFLAANGYETIAASSGPEGIERFERDKPDLLLVDVQLPRKNGFELVREIKSRSTGTPRCASSATGTLTCWSVRRSSRSGSMCRMPR